MRLLAIIAVSGHEGELLDLAVASAEREGVSVALLEGDAPHGSKLDAARHLNLADFDEVIAMDSDVVVWPGWRSWIERCLSEPGVVACGAPRIDAPGLHPSMLAMRADVYLQAPSFQSSPDADTGVNVSAWLAGQGDRIVAESAVSAEGWWVLSDMPVGPPLWWHLGSGSQYPQPRDHVELGLWADSTDPWFQQSAAFAVRRACFVAKAREALDG